MRFYTKVFFGKEWKKGIGCHPTPIPEFAFVTEDKKEVKQVKLNVIF